MKPSKKLIQETKALIQLNQFLRAEVGLKYELSAKELKQLFLCFKLPKKGLKDTLKVV